MELILLTIAGLLFSALVGVAGGTVCFLIGSLLDWGIRMRTKWIKISECLECTYSICSECPYEENEEDEETED